MTHGLCVLCATHATFFFKVWTNLENESMTGMRLQRQQFLWARKTSRRVGNRPGPTSVAAKLQLLNCTVLMVFIPKKQDNF